MCFLIFFVLLALSSQILHAMPTRSDVEENMVSLLSEKISHMERSMDIEMRMLKNEFRREIRGSCSKCVRNMGNTNISSLQFEVRTLHLDVKQLAASVERLSYLVTQYVENMTSPLMQKITSLVNASMDNSEQMKRIEENLMSVSKRLEDALRPTKPPVSATIPTVPQNVRLVNGSSPMSGRVEVYHDGEWGTICDDGWDDTDASVVCRMLGYRYGRLARDAFFGPGSGRIWLDDVNCENDSRDLADCRHSGWGIDNCEHTEDAGVECLDYIPSTTPLSNTSNEQVHVRLVGGDTKRDGRVEVYYTGREDLGWGTVCDDDWDDRDAAVVCRMLGFSGGGTSPKGKYGMGVGSIILDDLQCQGTEKTLAECGNFNPGYDNCGHEEDAGVVCGPDLASNESSQIFNQIQVRLVGGETKSDGRVEVYYTGREDLGWGTVCDDDWDDRDAAVVCRMLGFSGGRTSPKGVYGSGVGSIVLDDLHCQGTEWSLVECGHFKPGDNNCGHEEDAGVRCEPLITSTDRTTPISAIQIRLSDGPSPSEGRVEIYKDGIWGTVCDDGWDNNDAKVICRMLNYLGGTAYSKSKYGPGNGSILLDNVECSGVEQSITGCIFPGWWQHDCDHLDDAGVFCNQLDGIRLVNGSAPNEGRVEIQVNGKYGTICDDKFDDKAATVVCRMLGYNIGGVANPEAKFGEGSGPIQLDNVQCLGDEESLVNCQYLQPSVTNCEHDEDVGVTCFTGENVTETNRAQNVATGSQKLTESNMTSFYKSVCQETMKHQQEFVSESDRYWMKIWCEEYPENLDNSTDVKNSSALINANPEGEGSHLTTINHVTQMAGDNGVDKESYVSINITPSHSPASRNDPKDVIGQPEVDLAAFQCTASQFHCLLSGVCIEKTKVCDNEIDCPDVEDELDCVLSCNSREFQCTNGVCITAEWACDGEVDCSDGSDEVRCDTADVSCDDPSTFRCSDGRCIHATLVCDGDADCKDETDEASCDMIGNDGSFIFAAWDKIVVVSIRGEAFAAEHVPLKGLDSAVFLDVDRLNNTVYWSSPNYIHRANLNGSGDQEIVMKTGDNQLGEGIAVNQVDKTIYWTNKINQSISMTNLLDMTTVTIAFNITEPIDVYFNRKARQVYWTEGKTFPKISRADLDGSNRVTVVDTDLMWPHSLAIDHHSSRLYWTDIMKQTLEMIFLNGTGRRVLVGKLGRPLGITLIGKYVYWSDRLLQHVARINKETGLEKRVIYLPQDYQYFSIKTLSQIVVPEKISKS